MLLCKVFLAIQHTVTDPEPHCVFVGRTRRPEGEAHGIASTIGVAYSGHNLLVFGLVALDSHNTNIQRRCLCFSEGPAIYRLTEI